MADVREPTVLENLPVWVVFAETPPMYGNQVVGVYDNEGQADRHANRTPGEFSVARVTLNPPRPAAARRRAPHDPSPELRRCFPDA
jgi:hypothetical protein